MNRERLRTDMLILLTIIVVLAYSTWKYLNAAGFTLIDRLDYAPYAYRLGWHLTAWLSSISGLSMVTCTAVIWIISMSAAYLLLRPTGRPLTVFLAWLVAMSVFGAIFDGIAFFLLAVFIKYQEHPSASWLIIPIALFREQVAFVMFIYLVFYYRKTSLDTSSGRSFFAAWLWVLMFRSIGILPHSEGGAPFFTPPVILTYLSDINLLVTYIPMTLALIVLTFRRDFLWIWVLNLIPVLLFALFWEPQLWFPVMMLSTQMRPKKSPQLKNKAHFDAERIAVLHKEIDGMEKRGNEQALGQLYALLHKEEARP